MLRVFGTQKMNWERFRNSDSSILSFSRYGSVAGLVAQGCINLCKSLTLQPLQHIRRYGPRSGIILARSNEEIEKKLNSALFPGSQGGPLMHIIAAKAVCFKEAMGEDFVAYQKQTIKNAQVLANEFIRRGYDVVSGGTDNHLFLLDLVSKNITGKDADAALGRANITVNKNAVPNDPRSPFVTSGLRIGSPAITRREL